MRCLICSQRGHSAMYCPKVRPSRYANTTNLWTIAVGRYGDPPTPEVRKVTPRGPSLEEAVANQIGELVDGLDDFRGIEEMPTPARDLTAYRDAWTSARRNCPHLNVYSATHGRLWGCNDCLQYLDRAAMQEARGNDWWWSW